MLEAALRLGVSHLAIAVHPDAEDFYRSVLLFERIGSERTYPGLNRSARAVCLALHLRRWRERVAPATAAIYTELRFAETSLPKAVDLALHSPRSEAMAALARARPDVFSNLSAKEHALLAAALPSVLRPSTPSRPDPFETMPATCVTPARLAFASSPG